MNENTPQPQTTQAPENLSTLPFIKAHGTENDFVVLIDVDDQLEQLGILDDDLVASLCDRRAGVGGDGFLRIVSSDAHDAQGANGNRWFMDYRNADGSIAEMCGNGIRVFAHVLVAQGLEQARQFDVDTRAGVKHITIHSLTGEDPNGSTHAVVEVGMGPVGVTGVSTGRMGDFEFAGLGVDVGNPHLAAVIPGLTPVQLAELAFEQPAFDHEFFPEGVNVEIVTDPETAGGEMRVGMRVWERGVGETRSCGTGTVAAARAALADAGVENGTITVDVPGGTLTIAINDGEATMTGPSVIVARGEVSLKSLRKDFT
ncbi:diaminopimelate epimerase [Corynebacterium sp. CCUG 65737]|uniref:diaminopimelate epimerase n=1 Tax=Corynebacterium sp. CCUG 65737 TaxID=2823889 RepID=UPI00210D0896|nr:diaminopimelate epimerase [Corynebacterium sp. CCUG 65737]